MRQHNLETDAQVDDPATEGDVAHVGRYTHILSLCLRALYFGFWNSSRHSDVGAIELQHPARSPEPLKQSGGLGTNRRLKWFAS